MRSERGRAKDKLSRRETSFNNETDGGRRDVKYDDFQKRYPTWSATPATELLRFFESRVVHPLIHYFTSWHRRKRV